MEISIIIICIAVSLIVALMVSRIAKRLHMPAVTAYLVAGLLLGPFVIGRLGIPGIGYNDLPQVEALKILSQIALGFIAFAIGNEFRLKELKTMGKQAIIIGILQAVITTAIVDAVLVALHYINPELISISSALTLGAIAAATAPAATLMVVKQYKANGPLTKLLLMVVAIDDAVGLILFSVSFGIAGALESGELSVVNVLVEPLLEIVLSIVLGAIFGFVLYRCETHFFGRKTRLSMTVAFALLTVGISSLEFEVGGVHIGFSLLLVCMMTGTLFCNKCETSAEVMDRMERWTAPMMILFFVLSGAELDLSILANPLVLLLGVVYIIFRSLGKISGAALSCAISKCDKTTTKWLGPTLLPQAGVALGMALTASALSDGAIIRNVVLFSVLIYELVGPAITKFSLTKAGEIDPNAQRTNGH